MTNEQFRMAFQRYFEGQASEEERKALMQRIAASSDSELEALMHEKWLEFDQPDADITAAKGVSLLKAILEGEATEEHKDSIVIRPSRSIVFLRRWWAAASIMLMAGIGAYWFMNEKNTPAQGDVEQPVAIVSPGKEGAILTLADGKQVLLDTVQNGVVALQGGATARVVNGGLVYEGRGNEVFYNITSTPKGRQYNLTLPDGSKVWLNAASSIKYPTAFAEKERRVEVTGEAYFEVAKNTKQPFKVNISGKAEVEVLGTHFNINAYDNEKRIETTLLEGVVWVSGGGSDGAILAPGQQAQVSDIGKVRVVKDINLEQVIAWKSGVFNLNGLSLEEVMRQVERWYDIEVVYEKGIPDIQFGGEMGRGVSLNDLLKFMEGSKVHFRIEGKRLIVQP